MFIFEFDKEIYITDFPAFLHHIPGMSVLDQSDLSLAPSTPMIAAIKYLTQHFRQRMLYAEPFQYLVHEGSYDYLVKYLKNATVEESVNTKSG